MDLGEAGQMYRTGGSLWIVYQTPSAGTGKHTLGGWIVPDLEAAMRDLRAKGVTFEDYAMGDQGPTTENGVSRDASGGTGRLVQGLGGQRPRADPGPARHGPARRRDLSGISGFAGEVIEPDHAAYDTHREIWNAMVDRRPALIARCTSVDDVVAAVRHGREAGLEIGVRSGGHGVLGLCVPEGGLMIDLSPMGDVRSRSRPATGMGRWRCLAAKPRSRDGATRAWPRRPATSRTRASAG